jgi:exopolysaccharide production protein ExoZ
LRAFAALNVVLFHAIGTAAGYGTPVDHLTPLEGWGINGVDIFFVISGFMMAQIGLTKHPTQLGFLWDRIKRICPTYYFWTAIMLLVTLVVPQIMHNQHIDKLQYAASPLFMSQLLTGKFPAVFVGWTLEYEMLFYVIFAACLFAKKIQNSLWLCLCVLAGLVALGICKPLILEFGLGMCAAMALSIVPLAKRVKFAWPCVASGLAILLMTIGLRPDPDYPYLLIAGYGLPATLLVFGLVGIPQIKQRFLILIGDASYSIYLVQVLTLPAAFKIFTSIGPQYRPPADVAVILGVLATTVFGLISYYTVELTAKRWLSNRPAQTTTIAKA